MERMTKEGGLDIATRRALALRYARGEMSIHELRRAGHESMIELFSDLADLAELGERSPLAAMIGPNVDTRRAGLERLALVLEA